MFIKTYFLFTVNCSVDFLRLPKELENWFMPRELWKKEQFHFILQIHAIRTGEYIFQRMEYQESLQWFYGDIFYLTRTLRLQLELLMPSYATFLRFSPQGPCLFYSFWISSELNLQTVGTPVLIRKQFLFWRFPRSRFCYQFSLFCLCIL